MKDAHSPIIWSRVARTLHWIVAVCIVCNLINRGDLRDLHKVAGYLAIAAVFARIAYGFGVGNPHKGSHSRFANWPLQPRKLLSFVKAEIARRPDDYEGHNPPASWVYIGIWCLVLGLAVSGFMMGLDEYEGEDWLEEIHEALSNGVIILVIGHGIGIAKDAITKKRSTWKAMLTGRRS